MKNLIRGSLTDEVFSRVRHLKLDLGLTNEELMQEAVLLLLRYHGRADGLGEPLALVQRRHAVP